MKATFSKLLVIILFTSSTNAQVYLTHEYKIDSEMGSIISNAPVKNMPEYDFSALIEEEKERSSLLPAKFGHAFDANITNTSDGELYISDNKRIWNLSIQSKNAFSINLIFDIFELIDGAELFIYGKNSRLGPITNKHQTRNNKYATTLIEGDKITLVIVEPITSVKLNILWRNYFLYL